jgi:hypothetical protein
VKARRRPHRPHPSRNRPLISDCGIGVDARAADTLGVAWRRVRRSCPAAADALAGDDSDGLRIQLGAPCTSSRNDGRAGGADRVAPIEPLGQPVIESSTPEPLAVLTTIDDPVTVPVRPRERHCQLSQNSDLESSVQSHRRFASVAVGKSVSSGYGQEVTAPSRSLKGALLVCAVAAGVSGCLLQPSLPVPASSPAPASTPAVETRQDSMPRADQFACDMFDDAVTKYNAAADAAGEDAAAWAALLEDFASATSRAAARAEDGGEPEQALLGMAATTIEFAELLNDRMETSLTLELEWETRYNFAMDACGRPTVEFRESATESD